MTRTEDKIPTTLLEILQSDAEFLASNNIIDYSLLLGEIDDSPKDVMATI